MRITGAEHSIIVQFRECGLSSEPLPLNNIEGKIVIQVIAFRQQEIQTFAGHPHNIKWYLETITSGAGVHKAGSVVSYI